MQKLNQTPGTVLKTLLEKHGLNCNRLAKAINMSNAMVRLMVLDKSPISLSAAFRLAKFFKTKPEYWLDMQLKYDLDKAANDKTIIKELGVITTISEYTFIRKSHAPKANGKTGKKKETLAGKRKAAAKVPGSRPRKKQSQ